MAAILIGLVHKSGSADLALKSYSCECGYRFQASEGEDATKCLTCRIIDDLKAGRILPPASIRRPMDGPAMVVGGGYE